MEENYFDKKLDSNESNSNAEDPKEPNSSTPPKPSGEVIKPWKKKSDN